MDSSFFTKLFQAENRLHFSIVVKFSILSVLALFFFIDLESWQSIYSADLYSKRIVTFLFFFLFFFSIYNLRHKIKKDRLIFLLCLLDVLFLFFYAMFNPVPLNLLVGLLSLNLVLSGLVLSAVELALVLSVTVFAFAVFLEDRLTLNAPYTSFYYALNVFSFVVYGSASLYLQKFFIGNSSELGKARKKIVAQEALNKAVLSSVNSAVLLGDEHSLQPINAIGDDFVKTAGLSFQNFLRHSGEAVQLNFEFEHRIFNVEEAELQNTDLKAKKVWLLTDVTDKVKAQKELEQTRKLSAIGQLSAGLAHEIRNPLAGISGSVELIKGGGLEDGDRSKLFATVLKEIDRLNSLVTDFLSFATPSIDKKDEIQVKNFFEEMVSLIKLDAKFEGIELICEVQDCALLVDSNKLKQVFINLIVNALQAFTKDLDKYGHGPKVSVTGRILDSGYEVKVEDNGDGIKKENLASIFEPFHTTKDKGTGLGLALSHRILDGHGASIDVVSTVGSGTTFTVLFKT